ncbi:MAG: endo-1,3-alpha-glucanase family glycosylhydrolase [Sulfolobales archaeon]
MWGMVFGEARYGVAIFYDPRYPNSWLSPEESFFIKKYFVDLFGLFNLSLQIVDAEGLKTLLSSSWRGILIMAHDIAPDTVWSGDIDSLLIKWLLNGGILVWTGDMELFYVGYSNGSKLAVGDKTYLLYGESLVTAVPAINCTISFISRDSLPGVVDTILPAFSARPIRPGSSVVKPLGRCLVDGNELYDPVIIGVGKGLVARVFMTGGETNIVLRAAAIAEIVFNELLGIRVNLREASANTSFPRIVIGEYHNWYSSMPSWNHWRWPGRDPNQVIDGKRVIASAHYPLIGPYDSRDPRVIKYHIEISKYAGIDAFAIDWYGPGSFEDSSVNLYLSIAEEMGFKIAIEYEPKIRMEWGYGSRSDRIRDVINDLKYILSKYAGHPAYLKVNHKPVIFYFWPSLLTIKEWDYVFQRLREEGYEAVHITEGIDPLLLTHFTGIYEWEPLWIESKGITSWDRLREISKILREYASLYPGRIFLAGVWPGFDDEGVNGWGFGTRKYLGGDRFNGMIYENQWRVVLDEKPHAVMITTFNDWNEGTEIEPSLEYGFSFMEITRKYAYRYKGSSEPISEAIRLNINIESSDKAIRISLSNSGGAAVSLRIKARLPSGVNGVFHEYSHPTSSSSETLSILPYLGKGDSYIFTLTFDGNIAQDMLIVFNISYYTPEGRYGELISFLQYRTKTVTQITATTITATYIRTQIIETTATETLIVTSMRASTITEFVKATETLTLTETSTETRDIYTTVKETVTIKETSLENMISIFIVILAVLIIAILIIKERKHTKL